MSTPCARADTVEIRTLAVGRGSRDTGSVLLPALLLGATAALDPTAFVQATPHGFTIAGRPVGLVGANVSVIHGDVPRASCRR